MDIGQVQIVLWIGEFIGPFIIGWHCGWVALDDRGASCGLIGVLGSVLMIMTTLLASGWTASLLSIVALTGGFNGGVMTRYRGKSE